MEMVLTGGAILIGLYAGWRMLGRSLRVMGAGVVKVFAPAAPVVTSSKPAEPARSGPSSLQTDSAPVQTDSPAPAWSREQLLTVYGALRALGIPRERARPALKERGVPLDNNLWAQAAPPEPDDEALYETPIAGRTTGAKFNDPLLEYQPPPR